MLRTYFHSCGVLEPFCQELFPLNKRTVVERTGLTVEEVYAITSIMSLGYNTSLCINFRLKNPKAASTLLFVCPAIRECRLIESKYPRMTIKAINQMMNLFLFFQAQLFACNERRRQLENAGLHGSIGSNEATSFAVLPPGQCPSCKQNTEVS